MNSQADAVAVAVVAALRQVLRDTGREPGVLQPGMLLAADLGIDSLDLAQTIVLLERSLGVDPFRSPPPGAGRPAVRTVADLTGIYARSMPDGPCPDRQP